MKTDLLADRHIGIQEADLPAMLEKIGVKSLDELINKTIPSKIRLKEPLALASPDDRTRIRRTHCRVGLSKQDLHLLYRHGLV